MLSCKESDPDDTPKICTCPNGTLHLVGEPCCNEVGCVCEKDVAGQRLDNGIPVTNRTPDQVNDFNSVAEAVEGAFTVVASWGEEYEAYIPIVKNNVKEIRVIPGPYIGVPPIVTADGNKYVITMLEGIDADAIGNAFYDFVEAHPELE